MKSVFLNFSVKKFLNLCRSFKFTPCGDNSNLKRILLLCFNVIFAMAGLGIVAPILPQIQAWGDVSTTHMGLFVSSFALARVAVDIPAGTLSDRYGGSILTALGMAIILAGSLLSAFASSFVFLLLGRIAAGIGSALAVVSIQTELLQLAGTARRSTIMSYYMIARRAGVSSFPLIGGVLATFFEWRAVFLFCAILNLIGLIIALSSPSRVYSNANEDKKKDIDSISEEAINSSVNIKKLGFFIIYFLAFAIFLNRNGLERTILPLFGSSIGLDSLQIGLTLSFSGFLSLGSLFWGGYLADRYGRKIVLQIGLIVLILANGLFLVVNTFLFYLLASMFLGVAAFTTGLPVVMATDLVHSGKLGRTLGRVRLFSDLGTMVGPAFLGWLMDLYGYPSSIIVSILLLMLSILLVTFFLAESTPNLPHPVSNSKNLFPK